jgi:hypothetical protein
MTIPNRPQPLISNGFINLGTKKFIPKWATRCQFPIQLVQEALRTQAFLFWLINFITLY